MVEKAKIKTSRKTTKKMEPVSSFKTSSVQTHTTRFNSSVILKNKKIVLGIGIAVIALVLLAVLFKSIFIAAIVNGEPVTRLSVISVLEKQGGKTTLDNLITKKLILQEAKKRNVLVTQSDIDKEIKKIESNLQTQGSTLDQALSSQGMTKSDLNEELKIQVALSKMVGTTATITKKEINDFVTENKAQMTPETTDEQFREQATQALKQQKLQVKTQDFVKNLQDKAQVTHFVSY
jgi:parvulin-like peptidyl-prolyl isomerase